MERVIFQRQLFNSIGCSSSYLGSRITGKKFSSREKDVSINTMGSLYNSKYIESEWYDWWESKGYFKPKENRKVFSMILPPPNLTGTLHLGHALTITIQDTYMRWMRMKGENVLWIPGFDHAGIATELIFENYLKKVLNVTKHDIGKEKFLKKILEWKREKETVITEQMKLLGASVDWSKKYYTMDEISSNVVTEAFIYLFNKGLIVRCLEPVRWSFYLNSSVSDSETEERVVDKPCNITVPGYDKPIEFGYMHKFVYKMWDNNKEGEEIEIWTTRPETILGDTAIAVNPKDLRYSHLRDKFVWNPFRKCKIPIVFDEAVNPEVGSGVLKVTPAHSLIDFEIARRHNLEIVDVFDENGLIKKTENYWEMEGMKIFDGRKKILEELKNLGLYKGKQQMSCVLLLSTRTGDVVDYIVKPQWILKCGRMYNKMRELILNGDIALEPEFFKNVALEWFRRRKNWNLSRQIWFGHRIPMYNCKGDGKQEWIPGKSCQEARSLASEKFKISPEKIEVIQDDDVLDTWFSSALLPLTLSGWPKRIDSSYPFGFMETGGDIIFFWVTRMLMLSEEITGKIPFNNVFLHGMVCDSYGRKMSKSLGNVILPEDVIRGISLDGLKAKSKENYEKGVLSAEELELSMKEQIKMFPNGIPACGADALRLSLCGGDFRSDKLYFDVNLCEANKFLCNKIWQSFRYFLNNVKNGPSFSAEIDDEKLSIFDKWILSCLAETVKSMNENIADFQYYHAITAVRAFLVKKFCDIYLESSKMVFCHDSVEEFKRVLSIMFNCLETSTRLLSPFVPFLAEELYHLLPKIEGFLPSESVTVAEYPDFNNWAKYRNPQVEKLMEIFLDILKDVRSARNVYKLTNQKLKVVLACPVELEELFSDKIQRFLKRCASVHEFSRLEGIPSERNVIITNVKDCTIYLYHGHSKEALKAMFGSVFEKEDKLKKEYEKLQSITLCSDYQDEKKKSKKTNLLTMSQLSKELEKIKQFKEVIEKAR